MNACSPLPEPSDQHRAFGDLKLNPEPDQSKRSQGIESGSQGHLDMWIFVKMFSPLTVTTMQDYHICGRGSNLTITLHCHCVERDPQSYIACMRHCKFYGFHQIETTGSGWILLYGRAVFPHPIASLNGILGCLDRFTICIQRYKGHKDLVLLVIPLEENPACITQVSAVNGQTPLGCDKIDDIAARDMALRAFPVGRSATQLHSSLFLRIACTVKTGDDWQQTAFRFRLCHESAPLPDVPHPSSHMHPQAASLSQAMPRSPHRWLRRATPKARQELVVEPRRETAKVLRQRDSPAAEVDPANNLQVDHWGEHFPSLVGHKQDEPEQKIEDHKHHVTMQWLALLKVVVAAGHCLGFKSRCISTVWAYVSQMFCFYNDSSQPQDPFKHIY